MSACIPPGWSWAAFSHVAEITAELVDPSEWQQLPHIAPDNIARDTGKLLQYRTIREDGVRSPKHRFYPGQLLYSKIRPYLNKCVRVDFEGLCSADMYPVVALVNERYLHQYMLTRQFVNAVSAAAGSRTVLPKTNQLQLAHVPVPVCPLREQHHIVAALESYFTRLDDAVATLERVQRNLKRYRASVLKAAVEGRLVPTEAELARAEGRDYEPASVLLERILAERRRRWEEAELAKLKAKGKAPNGDSWKAKYAEPIAPDASYLPELPAGWCWSTVDQLAAVGTGATPKRGDSRFWSGGDVPWVTSAVVNEKVVRAPSEYVTRAALAETNLCLYAPGTLLIAMYGEGKTRGRATVLAIEATTNQALAALELLGASRQIRDWLLRFLENNYLDLRRSASGGVQPNLNLGIIRSIVVPLPPLQEQDRVVAEIDRSLSITEATHNATTSSVVKARRIRQAILKWAFEGRLVDQDPSDEPAARLLERISAERQSKAAEPSRTRRRKGATAKGRL